MTIIADSGSTKTDWCIIHEYGRSEEDIINLLYKSSEPNRFCAGFAKFLDATEMEKDYVYKVVKDAFRSFFSQLVCFYPGYRGFEFNCVGSIAYRFVAILEEAAYHGMSMGRTLPSVIDELAAYHERAR